MIADLTLRALMDDASVSCVSIESRAPSTSPSCSLNRCLVSAETLAVSCLRVSSDRATMV